MKKKAGNGFLFFLCLGVIFFHSCSRTEPRIAYGFIDLIYYPGEDHPEERFSFFIIAEDDDGMENLSELRLYNDQEGLEWILSSDDWIYYEEDGKSWIGSRSIAMSGDDALPRGQYRAMLINKGGERSERSLTFDAPLYSRYPYPFLSIETGQYTIDSRYPLNFLIVYDQQGSIVQTIQVNESQGTLTSLHLPNNARLLALWARDMEYHTSALTEAVSLR